jgi:hypothetical protein
VDEGGVEPVGMDEMIAPGGILPGGIVAGALAGVALRSGKGTRVNTIPINLPFERVNTTPWRGSAEGLLLLLLGVWFTPRLKTTVAIYCNISMMSMTNQKNTINDLRIYFVLSF